jgi:hypothetical protein
MTWRKWSAGNALPQWLAQDFEDMPFELGQLIQQQAAMMRQGHLPRQGQLAASDHALIGDSVVGGTERVRGGDGGAVAGEAGDAMDTVGVEGFGQAHLLEDGRQAAGQPRCPRARRTREKDVGVRTPA